MIFQKTLGNDALFKKETHDFWKLKGTRTGI
jgi:hypothetical protein